MLEGALVAIDNQTRPHSSRWSAATASRVVSSIARRRPIRQMGSTFKPLLYAAAIDRGLTPATMLVDSPATFDAGAGQPPYSPRNYDGKYFGPVTLRAALEQSRNVPAVRVMEMLGPRSGGRLRETIRLPGGFPAVSLDGARRRRGDAARSDKRLLGLPEPRHPAAAVPGDFGAGPRGHASRGSPAGSARRHSRRHRIRLDESHARRGAARNGRRRGVA